jgi:hypothetical protein
MDAHAITTSTAIRLAKTHPPVAVRQTYATCVLQAAQSEVSRGCLPDQNAPARAGGVRHTGADESSSGTNRGRSGPPHGVELGAAPFGQARPIHRLAPKERLKNIHLLAYNTRFLILPWVVVPHLASHLLGRIARRLSADWQQLYGHPIVYLETFVDPQRFRGTCYRAANWTLLGLTKGLGKDATSSKQNRPIKEILGYPLVKDFRERLTRAGAQ